MSTSYNNESMALGMFITYEYGAEYTRLWGQLHPPIAFPSRALGNRLVSTGQPRVKKRFAIGPVWVHCFGNDLCTIINESSGTRNSRLSQGGFWVEDIGEVEIEWNNPFIGSNSYKESAPKGYAISKSGGGGNNAKVTFALAVDSES